MFARTRDWADIEEMLAARSLDPEALRAQLQALAGADDERLTRLDQALAQVERADPRPPR